MNASWTSWTMTWSASRNYRKIQDYNFVGRMNGVCVKINVTINLSQNVTIKIFRLHSFLEYKICSSAATLCQNFILRKYSCAGKFCEGEPHFSRPACKWQLFVCCRATFLLPSKERRERSRGFQCGRSWEWDLSRRRICCEAADLSTPTGGDKRRTRF